MSGETILPKIKTCCYLHFQESGCHFCPTEVWNVLYFYSTLCSIGVAVIFCSNIYYFDIIFQFFPLPNPRLSLGGNFQINLVYHWHRNIERKSAPHISTYTGRQISDILIFTERVHSSVCLHIYINFNQRIRLRSDTSFPTVDLRKLQVWCKPEYANIEAACI